MKTHAKHQSDESMQPAVDLIINGTPVTVAPGTSVAVALFIAGARTRISVSGEQRGPLCAMGICMECCATINGLPHVRTCLITVQPGMQVTTG